MEHIVVNEPCLESWNKMKSCSVGKFCSSCSTQVIDFTCKGTNEIAEYLITNTAIKTCGRFNSFQLNKQGGFYDKVLNTIYTIENKLLKTTLTALVSCIILLTACAKTIGEPALSTPTDTTTTNRDTIGLGKKVKT